MKAIREAGSERALPQVWCKLDKRVNCSSFVNETKIEWKRLYMGSPFAVD